MERSPDVADGLTAFYEAFNTADAAEFGRVIADTDGVQVVGTAPDEGHNDRADWLRTYEQGIAAMGLKLESGGEARAFANGDAGYAFDTPSFVLPDGARLNTRLTAVMEREGGAWKMVHAHFSVGVPDEEAIERPEGSAG